MADHHGVSHYKKIYIILLVLLVISILGPEIGIKWVTLVTAFGIAGVKAWLVVEHFMHLNEEKKIVRMFLVTSVVLMALYFFGVAPDVMKHEGHQWENYAAQQAVERGIPLEAEYGDDHEEDHASDLPMEVTAMPLGSPSSAGFDAATAYTNTCAICHGATGGGDGPGGAALVPPPANFTDPDFWASRDDTRVFTAIKDGGPAVGVAATMAPWGGMYDDDQVTALVEYLKTMQSGQ